MKALVSDDDRIYGFTMIGPEAGEVVAVVQTAMLAGLPYGLALRHSCAPDDGGGNSAPYFRMWHLGLYNTSRRKAPSGDRRKIC